jgi:hypothetical protein
MQAKFNTHKRTAEAKAQDGGKGEDGGLHAALTRCG